MVAEHIRDVIAEKYFDPPKKASVIGRFFPCEPRLSSVAYRTILNAAGSSWMNLLASNSDEQILFMLFVAEGLEDGSLSMSS